MCGGNLICVCGACTSLCEETSECTEDATCIAAEDRPLSQFCGQEEPAPTCEFECTETADCAPLGSYHVCDRGLCRSPLSDCAQSDYAGEDFVLLGDNFLANSGTITSELENLLRDAGSLTSTGQLRDYSSAVVTRFGGAEDLFTQYDAAKSDGAAKVVILDAGGPDALLDCDTSLPDLCPTLQTAVDGTSSLFANMENDGVEQIVLFFYPRPDGTDMETRFNLLGPELEAVCEQSAVPCHFVELRPHFETNRDTLLFNMGLFPTADGSIVAAGALFSAMQLACVVTNGN